MATTGQWRQGLRRYWHRWLDKRAPPAARFRLNRRNLYTFPQLTGFVFLGLTLILWLLGTNYQNNLILALGYLLMSVFVVAILHAYLNLAAMQVRWLQIKPCFAGESVELLLELSTPNKAGCESLELKVFAGELTRVSLDAQQPLEVCVRCPAAPRGYWRPGHVLLQSSYPLGIIRCWTWLNLRASAVIYPRPQAVPEPSASSDTQEADTHHYARAGDDFFDLKPYLPGDPIRHIAWKIFARDRGLFAKEYREPAGGGCWLDWSQIAATDTELKLSGLCYWALTYHAQGRAFGLRLPSSEIGVETGEAHLHACLTALAVFGLQKP